MLVRVGLACALGLAALAASRAACAQEGSDAVEPTPARTVEIVVVGSERDFDAVRSTIGPNAFDGAGVRWARATRLEAGELLEQRPAASELGVRAWVDLSDQKNASLYFADRAGERFLVRAVGLPDGLTPLGLEALGQVLELSVRALLEDDRIGMSRAETSELLNARGRREPEPETPPHDEPPKAEPAVVHGARSSLGAEAYYGVRLHSSEVSFVHGPGLGLGWLTEDAEQKTLVWVTGQYELPREFVTPEVSVGFTTLRVEGGVGLAFAVADSKFFAGGRLGAGADFTSFSPRQGTSGEDVELEPSGVSTAPVVSAALEGSMPLFDRLGVSARLVASFYPVRVHYDVARGDEVSEVLVPYWIRPGVELCLHLR